VSILAPDQNGDFGQVALGFDNLKQYIEVNPYFGCLVGRCANRIAGGQFTLNCIEYALAQNSGDNHLHGGLVDFDKVVWRDREFDGDGQLGLALTYHSQGGEALTVQNLILGVNAHINYDLVLATADMLEPEWSQLDEERRQARHDD